MSIGGAAPVLTADETAFASWAGYKRQAPHATESEALIAQDAFLCGARLGYREGYRAAIAETASFGQVITELRHICSVLETACAPEGNVT